MDCYVCKDTGIAVDRRGLQSICGCEIGKHLHCQILLKIKSCPVCKDRGYATLRYSAVVGGGIEYYLCNCTHGIKFREDIIYGTKECPICHSKGEYDTREGNANIPNIIPCLCMKRLAY